MGDEEGDDGDEVEPERAAVTMPTYVSGAGSSISYNLKGPDLDGLTARAQDLQRLASELPGVAQIDIGARDDKPEIRILPDRAVLADARLTPSAVGSLLRANIDGFEAVCHAVSQTFRAVLMVIVASGLGMLPIALSTGIGSVNRVGIGATSVGGILVAGALTFLVVPALVLATARRPRARGAEKR